MTINVPVVEWYNVDKVNAANTNTMVVSQPYDFGIIDAGYTPTPADYYSFLVWNNRNNTTDNAPQMEEVTIGVKDSTGGNGNASGQEVWAINGVNKWFYAKVESLGETDAKFAQIGADLTKPIGTTGSTTNPLSKSATTWITGTTYVVGKVVKPVTDNGYIYKVVTAGKTGTSEPTWTKVEGGKVTDGTVEYETILKVKKPTGNNIILGGTNSSDPKTNANWATESAGNFARVTLKI
ncbi:hypothetical protein ACFVRU_57200, partial [Streptomyces sp. NPDC057927]